LTALGETSAPDQNPREFCAATATATATSLLLRFFFVVSFHLSKLAENLLSLSGLSGKKKREGEKIFVV
jgi:hypothetical protein